jgi:hypothetical protein
MRPAARVFSSPSGRAATLASARAVAAGAQFFRYLPVVLRSPINPELAQAVLGRRIARRDSDFLDLAHRAIYGDPGSPYRQLLGLAGCEYGDLERLVRQEGVEGTLSELFRRGVYLSVEEFKGRRPVIRGSSRITVEPDRLRNPATAAHLEAQSSGSRGPRTPVLLDLAHVRERLVDISVYFDARGARGWRYAIWGPSGAWSIVHLLTYRRIGARPVQWFSQVDLSGLGFRDRHRWAARLLRWGSTLTGVAQPGPLHVALDRPLLVALWLAKVLESGGTPHLHLYASAAVRLCRAALQVGLDLRGAELMLTGEPITPTRLELVRRTGARAVADYGSTEAGGFIAYGCLAPEAADDVHLFQDLHALIQAGPDGQRGGLPPQALLITSLRPRAPLILLNVSLGDQAKLRERRCGCPVERPGWTTHLHTIRSFEKLTACGRNLLDADVIKVLEEALPARFGGGATDYQLLEEEGDDGLARLSLLVDPAVGPAEPAAVMEAFLSEVGALEGGRMTELLWREAGLLHVERRTPLRTASGKIHHVHAARRP